MARTPRINHLRHRNLPRIRHAERLRVWLAAQAERLELTVQEVFDELRMSSAKQVEALPTPEPDPET